MDEDVHPQKNIIQSQERQQNIDIIDCDQPNKTEIAPSQKNAPADNVSITPPPPRSKTDDKTFDMMPYSLHRSPHFKQNMKNSSV